MHPNKYDQKKYCLDRFIDALAEAGVAERPAPKKVRSSPLNRLRLEYVAYLRDQRGLTEATIYHCVCFLRRFMAFRFGDTLGNLNDITPHDIIDFLRKLRSDGKAPRDKTPPSHLRNLFRFLFWSGKTKRDLAASIPWYGRRDRAILVLTLQTGLRVTELITLSCSDIALGAGAHVRCMGKGRKERATPIRKDSVKVLKAWLVERVGAAEEPLFVSNRGARLSRDAVERMVRAHVTTASKTCRSLRTKRVTPHVLRHSAAMQLLQNGVDRTVNALWLGHESVETTQMYIHADMQIKEKAMARTRPVDAKPGRYRPGDKLLAFLEAL
jgi:site-specific recombinase XerD